MVPFQVMEESRRDDISIDVLYHSVFGGTTSHISQDPHRRLRLAILNDALHTLTAFRPLIKRWGSVSKKSLRAWRAAYFWMMDDDLGWPASFVPVCETLGINPSYIRSKVTRSIGDKLLSQLLRSSPLETVTPTSLQ